LWFLLRTGENRKHRFLKAYTDLHCVPKRILDIIDYNSKKYDQILIVFGPNIPDTTGHEMTVRVPTSPSVCSVTTWENQNKRNINFCPG